MTRPLPLYDYKGLCPTPPSALLDVPLEKPDSHPKPSQHSCRIKSRREMKVAVGLESSMVKMRNRIKAMGLAYATSRCEGMRSRLKGPEGG